MLNNITIGSDPELFIINSKTKKVVSSIGLIPGEKGNPYRSEDMPEGFGLEIDNILGEFNTPPIPLGSNFNRVFISHINYMKDYIRSFVKKVNPNYDIMCKASAIVDEDQLQSDEANEFGCAPDFNAYTESKNVKPKVPTDGLRSAGTHIHVGYENPNIEDSLNLVKYFDMYLGVPSILIDKDTRRRELYGKAGSFRLTDYGVEYRVLSSYFISSDAVMDWLCNNIRAAIKAYNLKQPLANSTEVVRIIENNDIKGALQFCKKYSINYTV